MGVGYDSTVLAGVVEGMNAISSSSGSSRGSSRGGSSGEDMIVVRGRG